MEANVAVEIRSGAVQLLIALVPGLRFGDGGAQPLFAAPDRSVECLDLVRRCEPGAVFKEVSYDFRTKVSMMLGV